MPGENPSFHQPAVPRERVVAPAAERGQVIEVLIANPLIRPVVDFEALPRIADAAAVAVAGEDLIPQ